MPFVICKKSSYLLVFQKPRSKKFPTILKIILKAHGSWV